MAARIALVSLAVIMLVSLVASPGFAGEGEKGSLAGAAKELKAAVAAGKLTKAQAKEKWFAIQTKVYLAKMAKKLKVAVAAGKLTKAQAKAKWAAILKAIAAKKAARRKG